MDYTSVDYTKHGHNNSEGCYSHQGRTDCVDLHAYILCVHTCLYCVVFISGLIEAHEHKQHKDIFQNKV